jgi:hypothetical protein
VFDLDHLITGVLTGTVLIMFGLVRGLFQELVEGAHKILNLVSSGLAVSTGADKHMRQPAWLAILGALWIALSVVAYLSA